ncbi:hypothetical protein COCNU_03G010950 [Cocos nucifera]|uniref:Uncharacterized protein n=1 Tax=Cocos nucifera TaxID=13894 RepID=A0A8K0MZH5_COCNU|nr:hypothetical protein COCNU_03G010950 [Cocos nucifera]
MLSTIPPLVGMLNSLDIDFQISALYALLILGIGNDLVLSPNVEPSLPSKGQEASVGFLVGQWVPKIAINAYVASNIILVGEITIHDGASILYGELNKITIGFYSKVLHTA